MSDSGTGRPARVPGDLVRAMTALYLAHHPGWSRERLIRRLKERLQADGVKFHERSLRRQLGGAVDSVPPELEAVSYTHLDVYKRQRHLLLLL